ncbi:MAG: DUF4012 domain-containing protein [Candidatus Doudnabacteria bacterium]
MNSKRFSKIDIGSARRKAKPLKIKNVIKREVMSSELMYAVIRSRQNFAEVPQLLSFKPQLRDYRRHLVQIGSFALTGIILIVLLQGMIYLSAVRNATGEILGDATSAYTDLHTAQENIGSQNFAAAGQLFDAATSNINLAQSKLNSFPVLKWIAPQANSADHMLSGAAALAEAGKQLTAALNLFDELKVSSLGVQTENFNERLTANRGLLASSRSLIAEASIEFNLAGSLPLDYSQTLDKAKQEVAGLGSILDKLVGLENLYLGLFSGQKTYLLIFQNSDEARATGGFIGTYGVLQTNQGSISKLKIESIYQLDGQIYEQIAAPGPMQPEIKRWAIRDANWFADFPTTAQKLLYFFEKGSQTADGVISVTPKLFEDILRLTGPVEMDQYGVTLTPENFQQETQFKTSIDYDKTLNQPKKFLADFTPELLDRLSAMNKNQWFELFQIFEDNLRQRSILLYSKDHDTQVRIADLGFAGQILPADYDYLSINNSNLGGTKTDLSIDQDANLLSKVLSDGSVINTLTIIRKNSAEADNKNYLRVLVPLGSQFISASGFDDYQYLDSAAEGMRTDKDLANWDIGELNSNVFARIEAGKTEFAGWLNTDVGQSKSVTISYILPFKIKSSAFGNTQSYSLLVQKQSGSKPYHFAGSLSLGQFKLKWQGPGVVETIGGVGFQSETNTDDFWPMVIAK